MFPALQITIIFAVPGEAQFCVGMAEVRVGSMMQSSFCILWQWCLGCNLKRGQYISSLDELDNFNLPVLCVCSLITRSLQQFHCSLIALRSFHCVFYCASNWTTVIFFPQLLAGLRFSVHQQSEMDTSVKFDLQIRRYGNLWVCTSPGRRHSQWTDCKLHSITLA